MEDDYNITGKIVLLGESGVGKSSFCHRIKYHSFVENMNSTVGCEFISHKNKTRNGELVKLLIWDSAGQEVFRTFTPQFVRNAAVVLLFDDMTKPSSAKTIYEFLDYIATPTTVLIVPTKYELRPLDVNYRRSDIKSKVHKIIHSPPISSKENININGLVEHICCIVVKKHMKKKEEREENESTLLLNPGKKKKTCCVIS